MFQPVSWFRISFVCLCAALGACGSETDGDDGGGQDATGDVADAGADDGGADGAGDGASDVAEDSDTGTGPDAEDALNDVDVRDPDGGDSDTVNDVRGDGEDPGDVRDADDGAADAADGSDGGRVFVPGTLPLPDYIACDENSDCPNGTGNCVTALTLNRQGSDGRLRIPMSEVLPDLERAGVCTLDCAAAPSVCSSLAFAADPEPFDCQLIWADESPYPFESDGSRPAFPFDGDIETGEMAAGPAFGAICRPAFDRSRNYAPDFCAPCAEDLVCYPGSVCVTEQPWADPASEIGFCLSPCSTDDTCPGGFVCRQPDATRDGVLAGDADGSYCFPALGTCGNCADADGDGFGVGGCTGTGTASATDCDDSDPLAYWDGPRAVHSFPGVCGPDEDTNCNGLADDGEQIGTVAFGSVHCGACDDTCAGATPNASISACVRETTGIEGTCRALCDSPTEFFDCDGVLANGCETTVTDPTQLFVPDCDGDGFGRLGARPVFDCAGEGTLTIFTDVDGDDRTDDRRECAVVQAIESSPGVWGDDCNDAQPTDSPSGVEVCDGRDNDCDGETDPFFLFQLGTTCEPGESAATGVCRSAATRVCDDFGGVRCQPALPSPELCDGLDNDCSGSVDDLGEATPENRLGEPCRASTDPGPCGVGALVCRAGELTCEPALFPEGDVPGDGNDADCDGVDADTERALFVAVGGATVQGVGAPELGSSTNPVGSLDRALQLARVRNVAGRPVSQFILAAGNYTLPHAIVFDSAPAGTALVGGWAWDTTTRRWTASSGSLSTVTFTGVCACEPTPGNPEACRTDAACSDSVAPAAIRVVDPRDVLIRNVRVVVRTPAVGFGSVLGLACEVRSSGGGADGPACSRLVLRDVDLQVENGAPGRGVETGAAAGDPGAPGGVGVIFTGDFSRAVQGRGASSRCGAQGGDSAIPDVESVEFPSCNGVLWTGSQGGSSGQPEGLGGEPGLTGVMDAVCLYTRGSAGVRGSSRTVRGAGGAPGTGGLSELPMRPGAGTAGSGGLAGGGGGGGGADGYVIDGAVFLFPRIGNGGSSGGCGGDGGSSGGAGGTVIGLWIDDPLTSPVLERVTIEVGNGGNGGDGQAGGAGGTGSAPSDLDVELFGFYLGGASGHGAGGGGGGGGAGGWSVGVARWAAVPVAVTPRVGSGGRGGAGGAAGAGASGPIRIGADSGSTVVESAASGLPGTAGAGGSAVEFCALDPGVLPPGEVRCR